MKKLVLLALSGLLFAGLNSAKAQDGPIPKGSWYVAPSSSLSFFSTKYAEEGDRISEFNAQVQGGHFFADNFAAGLSLGYADRDGASQFSAGVNARYYILNKFIVGAGYSLVKPEEVDASSALGFEAGYAHFFNEHISLEPTLNYGIGLGDNKAYKNAFGVMVGLGIYF